jgi:hypothetical protein
LVKEKKRSGAAWRGQPVFVAIVVGKTRWAEFLEEIRVPEGDVLHWLRAEEPSATKRGITAWVRSHHHYCYVPEAVLLALAIKIEDEKSFVAPCTEALHWARVVGEGRGL